MNAKVSLKKMIADNWESIGEFDLGAGWTV